VKQVAGGNLLRVFDRVEEVAERLRKERPASEATIEELDGEAAAEKEGAEAG
jgi:hypothetical protein